MARRALDGEKPFRPLDISILNSVVQHPGASHSESVVPPSESNVAANQIGVRLEMTREDFPTVGPVLTVQRLDQEKRVLYTREERQALDRLVNSLALRLQTQLKTSHVLRALTSLLLHAEGEVDRRAGEHGALVRPANSNVTAVQRFEREIANILLSALRDAGAPR